MDSVFFKTALLCLALPCLDAQTVTVSASHLIDAGGTPLQGQIFFKPANPFRVTGSGQIISAAVSATVTNGAFSLSLADTTLSQPLNSCYVVWAEDLNSKIVLGTPYSGTAATRQGYGCVQVSPGWCSNGACNFDSFSPTGNPLALIQAGPAGPPGPAGANATQTFVQSFTSTTSVTITHGLNSLNISPFVYDATGNLIGYSTFAISDANTAVLTFATAQSGRVALISSATANFSQTFSAATTVTVTHGLGAINPVVAVFDASNQAIGYGGLTVTDSNNITLTFATPQSGRIVVIHP